MKASGKRLSRGILFAACLLSGCGGGGGGGGDELGVDGVDPPGSGAVAEGGDTGDSDDGSGNGAGTPVTGDPSPGGDDAGVDDTAGDGEGGRGEPERPTASDGPGGGSGVDAEAFSDDFDRDTLSEWTLRHVLEGGGAQYSRLDIDGTIPGALTLVPTLTSGWFADGDAPLVFKTLTGDFAVETDVLAESAVTPGLAPGADFNSAGLMARDPAGASGPENYVMVNIGRQDDSIAGGVGSETKSTRDAASRLDLLAGSNRGRLLLCRVGDRFSTYRLLDNETDWTRIGEVTRRDLPATLQVGMIANGFTGPDLRATFDYIVLRVPRDDADCTPER